jgi:threonine efflux protein
METLQLATILVPLGVYALAVPMPGPGLVVISRASINGGAANGHAAAFGTTFGVAVYALATVLGLSTLLAALPWITTTIQVAAGFYLLYIGASLLISVFSRKSFSGDVTTELATIPDTRWIAFRQAVIVGLGNPKMAVFFISLFAPTMSEAMPLGARLAVLFGIILIDLVYHQLLAHIIARGAGVARAAGKWFDALVGGCMTAFGIGLIVRAISTRSP